jgi:hypothetical protein
MAAGDGKSKDQEIQELVDDLERKNIEILQLDAEISKRKCQLQEQEVQALRTKLDEELRARAFFAEYAKRLKKKIEKAQKPGPKPGSIRPDVKMRRDRIWMLNQAGIRGIEACRELQHMKVVKLPQGKRKYRDIYGNNWVAFFSQNSVAFYDLWHKDVQRSKQKRNK